VAAASAAGAEWVELHHTGEGEGGYTLGHESPVDALEEYKEDVADEHGGAPPRISGMTLGGDVSTASLGTIASRVVSRQLASQIYQGDEAADDTLPEEGPDYEDPPPAGARRAAAAAEPPAKQFAPAYGQVNTYNWTGKQSRRFAETLTFPAEAVGDTDGDGDKKESPFEVDNALDHGYEHDLKLIDTDFHGSRRHPFCTDERERFWAQRKGYTWTTNFPKGSNPYFDDPTGDSCRYLDFTIGVEYPLQLDPGVQYTIRIRTRAGLAVNNPYYLNAQMTFRGCSGDPKYCSNSKGPGTDGQLLIGGQSGSRTQECRRWRKGYRSRRTCDFMEG
jgi:hypothetical protein